MKLKQDVDCVDFLEAVKSCRRDVKFETDDGDSLNLKSLLSQYLFAVIRDNGRIMAKGHFVCDDEEDMRSLSNFFE